MRSRATTMSALHGRDASRRLPDRRRGFTLAEVLAALLLMSIVLPSIMYGVTLAGKVADQSRRRTEAAGLAQMEMATILANQTWQNGNQSGDFGTDWPDYSWTANAAAWPGDTEDAGIDEIDLTVTWTVGGKKNSVVLCSLAYPRGTSSATATTP